MYFFKLIGIIWMVFLLQSCANTNPKLSINDFPELAEHLDNIHLIKIHDILPERKLGLHKKSNNQINNAKAKQVMQHDMEMQDGQCKCDDHTSIQQNEIDPKELDALFNPKDDMPVLDTESSRSEPSEPLDLSKKRPLINVEVLTSDSNTKHLKGSYQTLYESTSSDNKSIESFLKARIDKAFIKLSKMQSVPHQTEIILGFDDNGDVSYASIIKAPNMAESEQSILIEASLSINPHGNIPRSVSKAAQPTNIYWQ